MQEQETRRKVDQALSMAEKFQDRCHSAEEILAGLLYLPWWRFREKRRIKKKFENHYNQYIKTDFNEFIQK
jgi:hypothetical protein